MATTGALMTGLAFTATTLCTAGQAPAAQGEARTLVLHVENHARVPQGELARVEREAARVYEAAGVRVVWVHGDDEADTNDAGGKPLRVLLLGRNMTNRKAAIEDIGPAVLGRASRITGRAYVFVQRVIDLALASGKSSELMLSRVMAHEIGHLLLQEGSHSRTGIMRERLSMRLYQDELFTEPQAREIQLALNR